MDDHLDLKEFYKLKREESVQYLINEYDAKVISNVELDHKYPISLEIHFIVMNQDIVVNLSLPIHFPDAFPKIRLESNSLKKIYPLPHLTKDGVLCVFDEVIATPNPNNPEGILNETIKKTEQLLNDGLKNDNVKDLEDEFISYWYEESEHGFLSMVEPESEIKRVFLIYSEFNKWSYKGIFCDEKDQGIKWLENVGLTVEETNITQSLYVPLKNFPSYPYPKKNKDIYKLLKQNKVSTNHYFNFMDKNPRPSKILFSVKEKDHYAWAVWEHLPPFAIDTSVYKGRKKIRKELKGFRKGRNNSLLELVRDFPNVKVNKHSAEDIRNERLLFRGGDAQKVKEGASAAVIGCGAIGSHLIQNLVDVNFEKFLLIDPEILTFENVRRHLCGINDVGEYKTKAIKNGLLNKYPFLNIDTSQLNVLKLLALYPNTLNNYDYIFVAVSDFPTENRLRKMQLNKIIDKPVIFLWVEPFVAGGHAIFFKPDSKIEYEELFNEQGEYKHSILRNGNKYAKRELGCNTTFIPYSAVNLKSFLAQFTINFYERSILKEEIEETIFVWLGNIREQRKNQRQLSPKWVGATNYSSRTIPFE